MKIIQLVKSGLFLYEFIRFLVYIFLLILHRDEPYILFKLVLVSPAVLFVLMALFIWLDSHRYRAYLPLFIAGKCFSIFILLGWSIFSEQVTMIGMFYNAAIFTANFVANAEIFLKSGDFFALAAALLIIKDVNKQ